MRHPGRSLNIHTDRCLCGSGRLMRDCCLCARCDTTPPGPATGHANPKCFARNLKNCSRTISREHYISRSILRLFGEKGMTIAGMPWIPDGGQKQISVASFTAKMLCDRHNHALSPLDAVAAAYFRFFVAESSGHKVDVFLTRGYDLERWLLKLLCGFVASGNAALEGKRLTTWVPPTEWLDILFGCADVKAPAGLHSIVGNYRVAAASIHCTPVFKSATAQPIALAFAVGGVGFLFAMEALPPANKPRPLGTDTRYRPMALQLREAGRIREAHFGWPEGEVVTFDVSA